MHYADRVGPYIGHRGKPTTNENFAWQLARLRVLSEHTIGIVKGCEAGGKWVDALLYSRPV